MKGHVLIFERFSQFDYHELFSSQTRGETIKWLKMILKKLRNNKTSDRNPTIAQHCKVFSLKVVQDNQCSRRGAKPVQDNHVRDGGETTNFRMGMLGH